jgi:co-chaperonin GroES (HSP10)
MRHRHVASACYGYVVAVGPDAWKHTIERHYHVHSNNQRELFEERVTEYSEPFARVGDRVAFSTYVGLDSVGEDGKKYKTLNDEDIIGKVSENVTQTTIEARKPLGVA